MILHTRLKIGREEIPSDFRVWRIGNEITMDEAVLLTRRSVGTSHLGGWANWMSGICRVMAAVRALAASRPVPMLVGTL